MFKATLQALALTAALAAAPAHAARRRTGVACDGHGTIIGRRSSQAYASDCRRAFDGNNNNQDVAATRSSTDFGLLRY